MTDAMRVISDWLLRWAWTGESGVSWPSRVGFDAQVSELAVPATRSAWCYGTAGVAHALHLAATELGDAGAAGLALAAMGRPGPAEGPTFCHGDAGLLQISDRVGAPADAVAERISAAFDRSVPFGFRHRLNSGEWADEPGLLQCAAGVALALANDPLGRGAAAELTVVLWSGQRPRHRLVPGCLRSGGAAHAARHRC